MHKAAAQDPVRAALAELERAIDSSDRSHSRQLAHLAQSARRLRQFEGEGPWCASLADAAAGGAPRLMVFTVSAGKLRFQAARGIESLSAEEFPVVPLEEAAAFASAVQSSEPVIALKTPGELGDTITRVTGEDATRRFVVFPVTVRQRVPVLVYAEDFDDSVLELVATMAGAALECHMAASVNRGVSANASIASASGSGAMISIAPLAGTPFLSRDDEEHHLRAQRFARVQAAELRLYHSQAVKAGRADKKIYSLLRQPIDEARRVYREQYLNAAATAAHMPDYLHQEMVKTLANGNAELLGADYPGPLA